MLTRSSDMHQTNLFGQDVLLQLDPDDPLLQLAHPPKPQRQLSGPHMASEGHAEATAMPCLMSRHAYCARDQVSDAGDGRFRIQNYGNARLMDSPPGPAKHIPPRLYERLKLRHCSPPDAARKRQVSGPNSPFSDS